LGISPMAAPPLVPDSWQLKASAAASSTQLQLDPPVGLADGITLIDPAKQPYLVKAAQGGLVTIAPGLATALNQDEVMRRATVFTPFSDTERNRQEHALFIGSTDGLNVESAATI